MITAIDDPGSTAFLERMRIAEGENMRGELETPPSPYESGWLWDAPTIVLPMRSDRCRTPCATPCDRALARRTVPTVYVPTR